MGKEYTETFNLSLNPDRKVQRLSVGQERNTVILIDDVFLNPEVLNEFALTKPDFSDEDAKFYPGLKKSLPALYGALVLEALTDILIEGFELSGEKLVVHQSDLSIATLAENQLHPLQCMPHVDRNSPQQFASLVYLGDPSFGGTGFYRHRSTGYEAVTEDKSENYGKVLVNEVRGNLKQRYINGDTQLFERVGGVDARYNRLVCYRSNILHSGNIEKPEALTRDPRFGRLTANAFINY